LLVVGGARADEPAPIPQPSIALFYGASVPVDQLAPFDTVVIEPDSGFDPTAHTAGSTQQKWLAYVSVGEVAPTRDYYKRIPSAWLNGRNATWASRIIDQSAPGWPQFFVKNVIAPLWAKGYRGFFLDTLDSYQSIAATADERVRQQAGLVAVIRALKASYPNARLIFNRGFELMPEVHDLVYAVAFESLYNGWDQANKRYVAVPEADRQWLLAQARTLREQYRLPVLSIDYCPPTVRACTQDTIDKISAQGIIPYVTDGALQTVGTGRNAAVATRSTAAASSTSREHVPRTILVVQDVKSGADLNVTPGVRYLSMPLNWLGYRVEFANIAKPLPTGNLSGRYAGIVLWLDYPVPDALAFRDWLEAQIDNHTPIAMLTTFGIDIDGDLARKLDLEPVAGRPGKRLRIEAMDASMMGFEMNPQPDPHDTSNIRAGPHSHSLLRLAAAEPGNDFRIDAAAITPWGGYAMRPFAVFDMPMVNQARWVLQPIRFFRAALRLPEDMPAPDPTTENGRRLLMTHIDGDGLASRAEFNVNGGPMKVSSAASPQYSGDALYRVIRESGLPTTVSVIEGEISDDGAYPKDAPRLRAIAREMFALQNVEMASHTYTHPLQWMRVAGLGKSSGDSDTAEGGSRANHNGLSIDIPGYRYDTDREVSGSISYIDRLAPAGKRVKVLLWSGDCQVPASVIEAADKAGVYSMNGGDTLITKRYPSWAAIAPLGVYKEGFFQVFAPNQNEEPYTALWQGPYYGYLRVLETFDMTEHPIRFKPVDVYYHMFSGTKYASVKALSDVYRTLSAQPLMPVYVSEYAQKVLDFERMDLSRDGDFWLIHGSGALRTVRLPEGRAPDLASAQGVAGYLPGPGGVYVHLTGADARFRVVDAVHAATLPYLAEANGVVDHFARTPRAFSFDLASHVAPHFAIGGEARPNACMVKADGRPISPRMAQGRRVYSPSGSSRATNAVHVDVVCAT